MSEYIGWIDSEHNIILDHNQEIVRCRDCANYEYREHLGRSYCCGEYATEPDGFCSWAERRDA